MIWLCSFAVRGRSALDVDQAVVDVGELDLSEFDGVYSVDEEPEPIDVLPSSEGVSVRLSLSWSCSPAAFLTGFPLVSR